MKRRNSILLAICAAVLILAGMFIGVYARYIRNSGDVKNTFDYAVSINPTVQDDKSILVGDTEYPVYVRAAIVVTWQNSEGIVYFTKPVENSDYTLTLGADWTKGTDGYYYYKPAVSSGGQTGSLISSFRQTGETPVEDYALNVEIIAQTVQAVGYTDDDTKQAYQDAWGISYGSIERDVI